MSKPISLLAFATAALAAVAQVRRSASISASASASASASISLCVSGPVASNGTQCTVQCGTDHPGGDYGSLATPDFQTCINACAADQKCATAQYSISNSYCYLKSTVNPSTFNSNVNSVVCQAPPPPSPPAQDTCTAGSITINGRSGALQCGFDYPGGDYSQAYTGSFVACQSLCAGDPVCLTAQYDPGSKYCYLKSSVSQSVLRNGINTIIFSSTKTTPGCLAYAPVSPFMQSAGFEDSITGWTFQPSVDSVGIFTDNFTSGVALEGCNAYSITPSSKNSPLLLRTAGSAVYFQGAVPLNPYSISLKVGSLSSTLLPGPAPLVSVQVAGQTVIPNTPICGWASTGACPIKGIGSASGQVVSGQFIASAVDPNVHIYLSWLPGTSNLNPVLLDDVEIAAV